MVQQAGRHVLLDSAHGKTLLQTVPGPAYMDQRLLMSFLMTHMTLDKQA